jgi:elongation factor 1-beta
MVDDMSGGIAGVKIKIMPNSPEANLEEIETKVKELIKERKGINNEYSIEPIAFGLKALIAFFQWPEEKELEELEEKINSIENIQSVQVIDIRKIA